MPHGKRASETGVDCGRCKARTLMCLANVRMRTKKRFVNTTNSKHNMPVAKNLFDMWHSKHHFKDRKQRSMSLLRFINFYNTVKHIKVWMVKHHMKNYMTTFMIINCKQRSGFLHLTYGCSA